MHQNTEEFLAIHLPHLAPIARKLEDAMACADTYNGGHGVITIFLKEKLVPYIDVAMRHFCRNKDKKVS